MTKEEKIREVMELVQDYSDSEYALSIAGSNVKVEKAKLARFIAQSAIEAKLSGLLEDTQ